MSDHAQQVAQAAPTRGPAHRPAGPEPVRDQFADLSDLQDRLGNRGTAALIASALAGGGHPLGLSLRAEMERRFGHDLRDVRVHTGNLAAESARAVRAAAYTVGHDIVLGAGQDPQSASGRDVLLHELGHVLEHGPAPLPRGEPLVLGDIHDPAERAADSRADAARRGIHAAARGRRGASAPVAGDARVVRRQPAPQAPTTQVPVVPTPPELHVVQEVTAYLGKGYDVPPSRAGVIVVSGGTMRLYRNAQRRGTVRLAASSYPLAPGYYGHGRNADGSAGVSQLFQGVHQEWATIGRTDSDPTISNRMDLVVPADEAAYREFMNSVDPHVVWAFLQLPRTASGQDKGDGSDGGDGGDGGPVEETEPLPDWAVRLNTMLQTRLHSEQVRLTQLAKDTLGDDRPETLNRMWAAEGVPKRMVLGRTGKTPAEQVTVDRPKDGQRAEASAAVRLDQKDEADVAWERILTAVRVLYGGKEQRGGAPPPEHDPIGVLEGKVDPDAVAPNQPAYPSSIRYYGPVLDMKSSGVTGVPLHFTMNLDWTVLGEFAVFGPMGLHGYAWRFVRIQDTTGTAVDETARRAHRREAGVAKMKQGFGEIKEDFQSSSTVELLESRDLVAVDTVIRGAGTLIKSFVALASQPSNEQVITFDRSGVYLVTCVSSEAPVYAKEGEKPPFVRAPSVAAYTLRVESPKELAQRMVAPTQLDAARAKLDELAAEAEQAPADQQAEMLQAVQAQQEQVDKLVAQERANVPTYLRGQAKDARAQIELVRRLIALESQWSPPETWTDYEARALRVELQLHHTTAQRELARLEAAVAQAEAQQQSLSEVDDLKDPGYRPQVAFVPDADGRVLPVTMQLAELRSSTDAHQRWVLIDVSVPGHRDRYPGGSTSPGAAGRAEAISAAFEEFAGKVPYGRGEIGLRLPDVLLQQLEGHAVPIRLRAHPDLEERMWGRLESLATAAAIAGLVVTGPAAAALGVVGGLAGGAVAAHRMYRRYEGGYLRWDLTTAMDLFAIVGAKVGVLGPLAGALKASGRLVRTAGWVERGVEIYGYVQLGTSIVMVPVSYVQRLKAIPADASPGERAALAAEAFLDAANQSLQLAVTAAQMSGHAREPAAGEPDIPPLREAPAVEQRPQAEQHAPGEQHAAAEQPAQGEQHATAEQHRTAGQQPAAELHGPPTGESLRHADIEHGMVIMSPEGRSRSAPDARRLFDSTVAGTPEAEVALLRNVESGDFLVVVGDEEMVQLGEGNPQWDEILPERAKKGRWVLEEHSHAADPSGETPNHRRWPSGGDGDFLVVATEALRTGRVARGRIRLHTKSGDPVTTYAYHPGTARPYEVDIALAEGKRYQQRYATIEDYLADYSVRTREPIPEIPDQFPGARRTAPGRPAAPPTTGPPAAEVGAGAGEPAGAGHDVPGPARAPRAGAGERPAVRYRRKELAVGERAVQEAAKTEDPARIAQARQRLTELRRELLDGLEGTPFTAEQAARMADAGLDVAQMRALSAFAGDRAQTAAERTNLSDLPDLARFAVTFEPLLAEPATQAALEHLRNDATMGPAKLAEHLRGVPAEQLPNLMDVLADPFFHVSGLNEDHWALLREPEVIALIKTHGPEVWAPFSRRGKKGRAVLEKLAERVAKSPEDGDALVEAVLEARTPVAQERAVGMPPRPRRPRQRRGLEIAAAPGDPLWASSLAVGEDYVADPEHQEWVEAALSGETPRTREELVERVAVINQIRAMARRGQYAHLSREQRLQLLDGYIQFARETGFTGDFVGPLNQASGALSEALFLPEGARRGVRLSHKPLHPEGPIDASQKFETTLPDYEMRAPERVVPGVRNFVEQKSNQLSAETATGVNARDEALARKHFADAEKDEPGIRNAPQETSAGFEAPEGGAVHLIEYVRVPNQATREAMYDILLAPGSPLTAVKFGDLPWMTQQQWAAHRAAMSTARGGG